MTRRIGLALAALGLGIVACTGSAAAQSVAALRGKHLNLAWSDNRTERVLATGQERPINQQSVVTVYVSSEGRFFSQFSRAAARRVVDRKEVSGGRNMLNWRVEGATLVADQSFVKGARRLVVTLNGSGCSLRVLHGKEAGSALIEYRTMTGNQPVQVTAINVTSTSCSIADGNPFG
jgi:hypothetical protein